MRWMDYLGKGEMLTNTDLDRFVNFVQCINGGSNVDQGTYIH